MGPAAPVVLTPCLKCPSSPTSTSKTVHKENLPWSEPSHFQDVPPTQDPEMEAAAMSAPCPHNIDKETGITQKSQMEAPELRVTAPELLHMTGAQPYLN